MVSDLTFLPVSKEVLTIDNLAVTKKIKKTFPTFQFLLDYTLTEALKNERGY